MSNMTPIQLLTAAKQSIANDPNFDLNDFCHCVAPHVCKVAGDSVWGEYARVGGGFEHVANRAWVLLGQPANLGLNLFAGVVGPGTGHHHFTAMKRLDWAIDGLASLPDTEIAHLLEPERELVTA